MSHNSSRSTGKVMYFNALNQLREVDLNSIEGPVPSNRLFVILPYKNVSGGFSATFYQAGQEEAVNYAVAKENKAFIFRPGITKRSYIETIKGLKKNIQQGDIYEINYCIEFFSEGIEIDPVSVFLRLYDLTKAPYSRLVKTGDDFIISASPELFLKREGEQLYTKPIKGTVRRGKNNREDEELKKELQQNIKERTENVMAVDVARNDLSRVAGRGSVNVNKLYNIETYETVHHMVSTVSCKLKENTSFDEIIGATFPMASMTGAPKIRAMELISETEQFERNFYSGAMGFMEENGDFELSVTIRSIFYNQRTKRVSIAVGSAITHLCQPEKEYEECLLKANALLRALNATVE